MSEILNLLKEHWITFFLTLTTTGCTFVVKRVYTAFKKDADEQVCIKGAMIALLHDSLFRNCEGYIEKGKITVSELQNLELLYKSYHALGGNGTGTELFERCKKLEIM